MSEPTIASNVYYLPVRAVPPWLPATPPGRSWRTVLTHTFWRLRFAIAEIRQVFRMPLPVMVGQDPAFLVLRAEPAHHVPPPSVPARVIDFSAARRRRRPR